MKANSILDTIGNTPHIRVAKLFPDAEVWVKSERSNPGGSIKDRIGLAMIEAAEKDGKRSAAEAAGGHWDPKATGKHAEPWGDGHLGDLPALLVTADGKATQPVLAPRIKTLDEVRNLAVMVHAGGDNHADHPKPLGGGGARVACGVIR